MGCNQVCPYNTLTGCKVKEHNGICPLSNSVTAKPMTNADRIRAMSDEELADLFDAVTNAPCITICGNYDRCKRNNAWEPICRNHHLAWLQQPAEEVHHE